MTALITTLRTLLLTPLLAIILTILLSPSQRLLAGEYLSPDSIDGSTQINAESLIQLARDDEDLVIIDSRMNDRPLTAYRDSSMVQSVCLIPRQIVSPCYRLSAAEIPRLFFIVTALNVAAVIVLLLSPENVVITISTGFGVALKNGKIKTT